MPRYRESIWIETVIADALQKLGAVVSLPLRNTPFEYWMLNREGQVGTFFFIALVGSLVWLIFLEYSLRRSSKIVKLAASVREAEAESDSADAISLDNDTSSSSDTGDTPIMKKFAPPGHKPTNAQLKNSPFHLSRNLAHPNAVSYPVLPDWNETPEDWDYVGQDDEILTPSRPQGRNFARLAKEAPIAYESLRERGMLDGDGTPTKKYRLHQLLEEDGI